MESAKKKSNSDSIAEDSIIRNEFDDDNHGLNEASASLAARNKVRFGMHSAAASQSLNQKPQTEFEKMKSQDQLKLAEE